MQVPRTFLYLVGLSPFLILKMANPSSQISPKLLLYFPDNIFNIHACTPELTHFSSIISTHSHIKQTCFLLDPGMGTKSNDSLTRCITLISRFKSCFKVPVYFWQNLEPFRTDLVIYKGRNLLHQT